MSTTLSSPKTAERHIERKVSVVEAPGSVRNNNWTYELRMSVPLLISDLAAILISWGLASLVAETVFGMGIVPGVRALIGLSVCIPFVFALLGLYPGVFQHPSIELKHVTIGTTLTFAVLLLSSFVLRNHVLLHQTLRIFHYAVLVITLASFRFGTRTLIAKSKWWREPTAIFGNAEERQLIEGWLDSNWYTGLRVVDLRNGEVPRKAIVTPSFSHHSESLIWKYTQIWHISFVRSEPFIAHLETNRLMLPSHRLAKRLFEIVAVLMMAPLLVPAIILIGVMIKLTSPGPVFYSQRRIGFNGKQFSAWKFRSMVANADEVLESHLAASEELRGEWNRDHKLKDDPRITMVGKLIRKASIDEIPQLWNVIKGEMSLVGPRPIPVSEKDAYGDLTTYYAKVIPGLTGLWQVSGRNNTTYEQRLAYDSYYVRNWSLWLDAYLLLRTAKTVLLCEGAY